MITAGSHDFDKMLTILTWFIVFHEENKTPIEELSEYSGQLFFGSLHSTLYCLAFSLAVIREKTSVLWLIEFVDAEKV